MYACLSPVVLSKEDVFACGKCVRCRDKRVNEWCARLMVECASSLNVHWITLTYSDEFLPYNGTEPSLRKTDLQAFMMRLRNYTRRRYYDRDDKLRYVGVGEYGGEFGRPHYHALVIGCLEKDIIDAWAEPVSGIHMGRVHFREVVPNRLKYLFKYMFKSSTIEDKIDGLQNAVEPMFVVRSQGLGKCYLTPNKVAWHKADLVNRVYLPFKGVKFPLPRYLKDKLYTEAEKRLISAHFENLEIEPLEFEAIQIIQQFNLTARDHQRAKTKKHDCKKLPKLA